MATDLAIRASAVLEIDLAGIVANWRLLAARVEPAGCTAVVKADAYGLGAREVSAALAAAGCRLFFVATLDEAIALRLVLPASCEIAVLDGPLSGSAEEFVSYQLVPVLNEPGQIAEWAGIARRHGGLPAILHVDTGMARLGLSVREFERLADKLSQQSATRWRALISHLACADLPAHPLNEIQLGRFVSARRHFGDLPASLAASSGIFLHRRFHFDFVRPGAALYGINPQPGAPNPMRQIVRLKARIVQVREVDRGESVGYGAAHVMEHPGRLATVAVGYADGWLRSLSHRGSGRLGDTRLPLLGRVSMDLVVFDVSAVDPSLARPGGFVELLDEDYGVDAAAADAGTIGYEILTALSRRCHRVYRGAPTQC
ncbi:MAG TPA: alanine racemase [Stellaceae bacterium]|nr:alanine racemase [Stellaceae bacterium]